MENSKASAGNRNRHLQFLQDIWEGALDLVYPPKCLVCGDMQPKYFCDECLADIVWINPPVCSYCGMPVDARNCLECAEVDFSFDSARSAAVYDGALKDAIHQFKYSGHKVLGPILAELVVRYLRGKPERLRLVDCVIPVPIHPSRLRQRGFNQSEILADEIGRAFSLPVLKGNLTRIRPTRPQIDLPRDKRRENVADAFYVETKNGVAGRNILLVDDVFTTGCTSDAAARTLKDAGAKAVHVLTLARSV